MQTLLSSIRHTKWFTLLLISLSTASVEAQTGGISLRQIFGQPSTVQATHYGTASSQSSYQGFGASKVAENAAYDRNVRRTAHNGPDPYDPEVWRRTHGQRKSLAAAAEASKPASRSTDGPLLRFTKSLQGQSGGDSVLERQPQGVQSEEIPAPDSYAPAGPSDVIVEDGTIVDEGYGFEPPVEHDFHESAGPGCDNCQGGGVTCAPGSRCCPPGWICMPLPPFDDIQFGAGIDVFDRPTEANDQGDFGLHQSVNLGGRLPVLRWWDLGYQVGLRAEQSEVSGTDEAREQYFFTVGFFRPSDTGVQWGFVYDHLSEDVSDYNDRISLNQMRGELSYLYNSCREVGYLGMWGLDEYALDVPDAGTVTFEVTSQHLFFHRWYFSDGSEGRLWAGFSNHEEGILGGDAKLPLSDRFSVNLGFNFLIPEDDGSQFDPDGAWNVSVGLVWHIGAKARGTRYRPMFDVGGNGTVLGRIK